MGRDAHENRVISHGRDVVVEEIARLLIDGEMHKYPFSDPGGWGKRLSLLRSWSTMALGINLAS